MKARLNSNRLAMAAQGAAETIERWLLSEQIIDTAIVVGPGWDVLDIEKSQPLSNITSFSDLSGQDERQIAIVNIGDRKCLALINPIYLREAPLFKQLRMARIQIEMLCRINGRKTDDGTYVPTIKRIVLLDGGAGVSIPQMPAIIVVDGFVSLFANRFPLSGEELLLVNPTLDHDLIDIAQQARGRSHRLFVNQGGFFSNPGSLMAGGVYDHGFLLASRVSVVGKGLLFWASITALYPDIDVLALALLMNNVDEELPHPEILGRAKKEKRVIKNYLTRLFKMLPKPPAPSTQVA